MNKNQKPSMSKRRATVAAVLCFVAAIAIAGTYTFNDYRKTQKNELAKAEEKAKQDSEAAKETGTSKIKNEDMTSDTDESDSNGTGKDGTTTGSGTTDSGTTDSGTTGTSGSRGTRNIRIIRSYRNPGNGRKKSQYQLYGRQLHPVAGERSCDHELQYG